MPDYDYICPDCEAVVERYFAMGRVRRTVPCQNCGGTMLRVFSPFQFDIQIISNKDQQRIDALKEHD